MEHVIIVDYWEKGKTLTADVISKIKAKRRGKLSKYLVAWTSALFALN